MGIYRLMKIDLPWLERISYRFHGQENLSIIAIIVITIHIFIINLTINLFQRYMNYLYLIEFLVVLVILGYPIFKFIKRKQSD